MCRLPLLQTWSGWLLADLPLTALFLLVVAGLAPGGAASGPLLLLPAVALTVLFATLYAPRALVAYALVSGAVVLYGGYRPVVRPLQGETLRAAVYAAERRGAARLWVYADRAGGRFGAAPLAALVDLYTSRPVVFGGDTQAATGAPDRWWEVFAPLPSHLAAPDPRGTVAP